MQPEIVWIEGEPPKESSRAGDPELAAGMLLRTAHGVVLVGDVNDRGGCCDCCGGIHYPVLAYSTSLIPIVEEAAAEGIRRS